MRHDVRKLEELLPDRWFLSRDTQKNTRDLDPSRLDDYGTATKQIKEYLHKYFFLIV